MIKEIAAQGSILALILDLSDMEVGTISPTNPGWSLQVLMRKLVAGHSVGKHTHKLIEKSTKQLNEGLVVIKGAIQTEIFDAAGVSAGVYEVTEGQCLFFAEGGHSVEVLNDALIFEFKNGPYVDDKIAL